MVAKNLLLTFCGEVCGDDETEEVYYIIYLFIYDDDDGVAVFLICVEKMSVGHSFSLCTYVQ
jgi:hypothetical protein